MKVLLLGATGMLGTDLHKQLASQNIIVIPLSSQDYDLKNKEDIETAILSQKDLDYVINCAAYTQVDQAESEQELAHLINAVAVEKMVKACKKKQIPFVQLSTDYVFDGTNKDHAYVETDSCQPINTYGYSKWLGEQHCLNNINNYYIFRVQWLYGDKGHHFIKTMIQLMHEKQVLKIVADQWGSPTSTTSLARYITQVLQEKPSYGIYHCTDEGVTTWYTFAKEIAKHIGYTGAIKPVTSEQFVRPAKRPKNGRLNCRKLANSTKIKRSHWKEMLKQYLLDYKNKGESK
ncbi:dTDP-4-dehydrorhamnose reductase [Candidatus Marinamargulisbacteria bacterium SCGC AG-333-B06]|nr:dTDP-4-dehydrorhamnose reductase [Candidatus Marinamargulisbacteria bacterium SCGC AG-333-B06]